MENKLPNSGLLREAAPQKTRVRKETGPPGATHGSDAFGGSVCEKQGSQGTVTERVSKHDGARSATMQSPAENGSPAQI